MRRFAYLEFSAAILLLCLPGYRAHAGQNAVAQTAVPSTITISSPLPGQPLQGIVPIIGHTAVEGFQSAELSFAYFNDQTQTWFLIIQSNVPIANDALTQWDTTTISDGVYTLRLTVVLVDGSQKTMSVPGLRVRNYTPIETNTPAPITPTTTLLPGNILTSTTITILTSPTTSYPSPPTPLPPNPEQLSSQDVFISVGKGALATAGLFALFGVYQTFRSIIRKRYEKD